MMPGADVVEELCVRRVVPVVVLDDLEAARPLGRALRDGGLPVAEVTFRTAVAARRHPRPGRRRRSARRGGHGRAPGAGRHRGRGGRALHRHTGAEHPVVARCRELELPVVPGVATATEIIAALDCGCELLKFFPAGTSGGVPALRALSAPFPQVRFIPTGGIGAANAGAYLELPSVAAVGGSWMVPPSLIAAGDFAAIEHLAREAVGLAAGCARERAHAAAGRGVPL